MAAMGLRCEPSGVCRGTLCRLLSRAFHYIVTLLQGCWLCCRSGKEDEEHATLRWCLHLFLIGADAFFTVHTRTDQRKLGQHLLGTFDLLRARGCDAEVCAAGALHSIYGTSVFKKVSIAPTPARRAEIAAAFGERAERLAFLFHACDRPGDLERGRLVSRFDGGELQVSPGELQDLRLIEGANFVDQGAALDRFPTVAAEWAGAAPRANMRALRFKTERARAASERRASWLRLLSRLRLARPPVFGVRLRCQERWVHVPLPVPVGRVLTWLHSADPALRKDPEHRGLLGFLLTGEGPFGMPPAPADMVGMFQKCCCAGYDFEVLNLPAVEVSAVKKGSIMASDEPAEPPPELPLERPLMPAMQRRAAVPFSRLREGSPEAARNLVQSLTEQGWATVEVDAASVEAMHAAYLAVQRITERLTQEQKRAWRRQFDGTRFVGFASDGGREWVQWRSGMEDPERIAWPEEIQEFCGALSLAYARADATARAACSAILEHLGLAEAGGLDVLLDDAGERFGASVMRFFAYSKRQRRWGSAPHADMGLVTVAAPSTFPALRLWHPVTGQEFLPEQGLAANEWVVFAGETMGFVTGGQLQAPIHAVPSQPREAEEAPRCSAPFFLRAAPGAVLKSPSGAVKVTNRDLMELHAIGLRPWRLGEGRRNDW